MESAAAERQTLDGLDKNNLDQRLRRVVHISSTAGRISEIAENHIRYVDDAGESRQISLQPGHSDWPSDCVGLRKLDEAPWTVELWGDDSVTFVFEDYEAAYELLLNPLGAVGRRTVDIT